MQENLVAVIRELMQTQQMSIRKISAKIAKEHGGSALGYTQQINRILNDPDYDPNLSTIQKILVALNYSIWQSPPGGTPLEQFHQLEQSLKLIAQEVVAVKSAVADLQQAIAQLTAVLAPDQPPMSLPPSHHDPCESRANPAISQPPANPTSSPGSP